VRIGIGQITSGPITLVNGKVISNPQTQAPGSGDCLPYQCGADSGNIAALEWCSSWGQVGAFPCSSSQCSPVSSYLNCPKPATAAPAPPQVQPKLPALTPANVVQPLPDITATLGPLPAPPSPWCLLNSWIGENPIIAVGVLAAVAIVAWPKGRA